MGKLKFFFKKIIILSLVFNPCLLFAQRDGHYWGEDGYATIGAWIFLLGIAALYCIANIVAFFIQAFSSDDLNNKVTTTTKTENKVPIKIFSKGDDGLGLISLNHNLNIAVIKLFFLNPLGL